MQFFDLRIGQPHRLHHFKIAGSGRLIVDRCRNALPSNVFKLFDWFGRGILLLRVAHNRFRQRMLGNNLQGQCRVQQNTFVFTEGNNLDDFRFAGCDRAGFVQDHGLKGMGGFQCFAGFDQNSVLCPFARSHHNRCRRG